MNNKTRKFYFQLRERGYTAKRSLLSAKTIEAFKRLEFEGKVRLRLEPEQESYFDVFGEPKTEAERERIIEQIENLGCYGVISEYSCHCGQWQLADSIGFCIYEQPLDPFDNEYCIDLMHSALKQLQESEVQNV
jgi:hypothetical protein